MTREKKLVLAGIAVAAGITILTAIFAPSSDAQDPRPTTSNAGAQGVKAAYVLLQRLGYQVRQSDDALTDLDSIDADRTTLIIANEWGMFEKPEQAALERFIKRGGHVLADGSSGARLLPGFYWRDNGKVPERCLTTPVGTSPLAEAGPILFHPDILAKDDLVETSVAQACGEGAAVISYAYGRGSVVWWASPEPFTNRGLHEDANLRLFLASIGAKDRTIVFNESEATRQAHSVWDKVKGLPLTTLAVQLLLVLLFLILAYGRRHGPLRTLATTPRTSPLEFAHSMGNLYHKAGAGEAAIANARLRLIHLLEQQCGVGHETVAEGAEAIALSLRERFNFTHTDLIPLLEQTETPQRIPPAKALEAVRRVHQMMDALRHLVSTKSPASQENLIV